MFKSLRDPGVMILTLVAAGILAVTMGARQSLGLFLGPINTTTGLGITTISFAMAVGQFAWGAVQPFAGAAADRWGPRPVLVTGVLVMALGSALVPLSGSALMLVFTLGLLTTMGSGTSSFSVLMGAAASKLPDSARGSASGLINAGGSFGQFIFPPLTQKLIQALGWMNAMWALAAMTLLALPLVARLTRPSSVAGPIPEGAAAHSHDAPSGASATRPDGPGAWSAVRHALRDPSYLLLHAGFFTCGFHVAFLVTHLPGEVDLCGLPASVASWSLALIGLANIVGSIVAGHCVSLWRSKYLLAGMYASRAVLVLIYLAAPKTDWTFYAFAVGLGLTWLSTVPPTAAIVGKLFGVRHLATLFGLTLLSHQIGGFLGAWLGGLAIVHLGDYQWMWWADMALALAAAALNLPIREARIGAKVQPA